MKYLKDICNIIGSILLVLNIIFAYIWKGGFYYFRYVLACIALSYLLLSLIEYTYKDKKVDSKLKRSLIQKTISLTESDFEECENSSTNSKRSFDFVFSQIYNLLPDEKKNKLRVERNYWSPESLFSNLATFVNYNVIQDSANPKSVKIYSILCNKSEDEIKQMFMKMPKDRKSCSRKQ